MTTAERADLTRRLDDLDARMTTIEADHADLTRRLATVPTRCRAHLAYAALCPAHNTTPTNSPQPAERTIS